MPRPGFLCLVLLLAAGAAPAQEQPRLRVEPGEVTLRGPDAGWSLLVTGQTADGRLLDLTSEADYRSANPRVVSLRGGRLLARGDGTTVVTVEARGQKLEVPVRVEGSREPRVYSFRNDILPVLGRHGCNASGCHGKAEGQNGFKLSVFGFDPEADYAALVKEARGRRILPAAPAHSLLLRKMVGQMPHGGGARLRPADQAYTMLRDWIAAGAPLGPADAPEVVSLRVEPGQRTLEAGARQQLRVVARYSDSREEDVTPLARFEVNHEALARVSAEGLVQVGDTPGEAAVMASYQGQVDLFRLTVPRSGPAAPFPDLPERNVIDRLVFARLRQLRITPSAPCDDAEYLRRVHLDVIGTLPTAEEARRFLADRHPEKRSRLVEDLLRRPEYADYWALQWADRLRVSRQVLGAKQAHAFYRWIHRGLAANVPLDRFCREILTAEGPLDEAPAAAFFKVTGKPGETASTVAQVFLGIRIACAECHHHPFDRWTQTDYHGMVGFFSGVGVRKGPAGEMLTSERPGQVRHPRTGEVIPPHALGQPAPSEAPEGDRRRLLAAWLTGPDNPWFARNLANRMWAHFLGRGLVEPVDDVRATNPPTNPELLDALARHLVENGHDAQALIRLITASQVYQLSSRPNATNERDEQGSSRALLRRLPAEVLLDMVSQATGVPDRFDGAPTGTRAIQLWDSKVSHYFLRVFGRPERLTACECERQVEPSVAQVLHMLNSPEMHARLTHAGGTVSRLLRRHEADGPLVEQLYLTFLSRYPSADERARALEYLKERPGRRQAVEDLAWSLLSSLEFLFNH